MRLILLACLLLMPTHVTAQQILLSSASMFLPPGFTHEKQVGKDSEMGRIAAQDSSLVIQYDIGLLAGGRAHPSRRNEFIWFLEHEVNGQRAYSGIFIMNGDRRISTMVLGDALNDPAWPALVGAMALPANFEASIKGERELATFMAIVASYRPRARAASGTGSVRTTYHTCGRSSAN